MTVLAILTLLVSASHGAIYTGSLASDYGSGNSTGADGLLLGAGAWVNDSGESDWVPAQLEWEVSHTDILGAPWLYHYKITVYEGALSHLIVEASDLFSYADMFDEMSDPDFEGTEIKTHYPPGEGPGGNAQPGMPDSVYGIKFDDFEEPSGGGNVKVVNLWFKSFRGPVWGDLYIKGGKKYGSAWNAGFVVPDSDPDPFAYPASCGSVLDHLLVPDTYTTYQVVPEPTTMTFLGLCLGGLFVRLRRKSA